MSTTSLEIEIAGVPITPLSARISKTMDEMEDSWAAPIAWTPGIDRGVDSVILPFQFFESKVSIDGIRQITGPCYISAPSISGDGRTVELSGASKTAEAIDSTAKPPYFEANATLETRAKKLLAPFGIQAKFEVDGGGPFFDGMTIEPTEKVGEHLLKYSNQRGILVSNTARGDALFWKAKTTGFPVASIEEGADFTFSHSATEYGASYNSRNLYNTYRIVRDTPGAHDPLAFLRKNQPVIPNAVSVDNNVPSSRFLTIQADETTSGDIQNYAEFVRSKIYAEALTMVIPMPGWLIPFTMDVWEVNTLVSVASKTLMFPNGFTFIIRGVEFLLDNGSQSTNLSIVPPQVYSGEPVPYIWSV